MPYPRPLIFSPADAVPASPRKTFELFPSLPPELRVKIWRAALERQRIIRLRLRNRLLMDGLLARQGKAGLKTRKDECYSAVVNGYQTLSKFFRVNRESRDVALGFYRVHVPCWLVKGATRDDAMEPGTFYFNPEYDFLWINTDTGHIPEFFHDLKTIHDPSGVGLLNLAVDHAGLIASFGLCSIDPLELDPLVRKTFTEILTQLHEVFFVQIQWTGRQVFGYRNGALTPETQLNLAFPIFTVQPSFDRYGTDPRPIGRDLAKVFVNTDPRHMLHAWDRLFYDYFGGSVIPETEYRILLAYAPFSDGIYDCMDARTHLGHEEDDWVAETSRNDRFRLLPGDGPEAAAETAFGFWLFPVNAFGPLPQNPTDEFRAEQPRNIDLREYWPELALANLI
ncbi:hypothetical protein F5Y05DRAFT_343634 [Hypoxylon sp. FL0543]|nr:hypothetical protein F5Y05DRAFT_343634 [Hypoxylon sp. FL0543]